MAKSKAKNPAPECPLGCLTASGKRKHHFENRCDKAKRAAMDNAEPGSLAGSVLKQEMLIF